MTKYAPLPMVASFEDAIQFVLKEKTDCGVEWYSIGKTNADLRNHMLEHAIDSEKQGVFIGGNKDENPKFPLTFMPLSWMRVDEKLPSRLAWRRQFDEYQKARFDTPCAQ